MTLREFIAAIPKVELNLQLTGALRKESLLMIARQNGVPAATDDFEGWVELLDRPDYERLDEIARVAGSWAMYPEDIALAVYDIGVTLSKQNVRYAEIAVTPSDFIGSARMNIDVFLDALNDGRDRALRGWKVDMSWILCIPRNNPRAGDDVARWATSSTARQGNVVALGLTGEEDAQPVGQFRRAFGTAQKKELFTVANAGSSLGASDINEILDELQPLRLIDSWGIAEDESTLSRLRDGGIPVVVSLTRALRMGLVETANDYPLKHLLDSNLQIALSSGMPSLYQSTLIDEYALAHDDCGLTLDELVQLARRSIELSYLDEERKDNLLRSFDSEVESAKATFLSEA